MLKMDILQWIKKCIEIEFIQKKTISGNSIEVEDNGVFYVLDPYFIRKFRGFIIEKNGTLEISEWDLLEQTFYREKPKEALQSFLISLLEENKAYMIDQTNKEYVQYYQKKNEFGSYEPSLETAHYLKIENNSRITIPCENHKIELTLHKTLSGWMILPIMKVPVVEKAAIKLKK